jgi:predicted O-methyltransferase YrrM
MKEELLSEQASNYLEAQVPQRPKELQLMEAYAREQRFPIIGPAAGYFCYQLARMTGARRIFELGSGYGYSTAWFAKAVQENGGGVVHHVVWDKALSQKARKHLSKLGYDDIVQYTVGEAVEALRNAQGPFDIVFNDIDKQAYAASLAVIDEKLKHQGVLIVDNMLYSGRVFNGSERTDNIQSILELTTLLTTNPGWISTIVPIRDGLAVAYKV